jgi:hypothetical protein
MVVEQLKCTVFPHFILIHRCFSHCDFFLKNSDMAKKGFTAYDSTIGQEVLVMTSMLCFLADSPMHAKITNTHVPGNALNSCRYCILRSSSLKDRRELPYLSQFMQKKSNGKNVSFPLICSLFSFYFKKLTPFLFFCLLPFVKKVRK